ncbi:hypothetical protein DOTSEDRAFT_67866 [Dothistroma septosporum NZE10]|uniref:Uncharacterized protein n=1 Tax=Dothistroma septosporum (strain NZE10 / CBS 128990) TaxID=675120 RepID=N1Q109_DOTSN|nr:hypothetical protein DOTSEDRAFT_67866 [Dothistroma septosporum NZE10]
MDLIMEEFGYRWNQYQGQQDIPSGFRTGHIATASTMPAERRPISTRGIGRTTTTKQNGLKYHILSS